MFYSFYSFFSLFHYFAELFYLLCSSRITISLRLRVNRQLITNVPLNISETWFKITKKFWNVCAENRLKIWLGFDSRPPPSWPEWDRPETEFWFRRISEPNFSLRTIARGLNRLLIRFILLQIFYYFKDGKCTLFRARSFVKQRSHVWETMSLNPRWGDHFSCNLHLDLRMDFNRLEILTWLFDMCCNPANGRVDFEEWLACKNCLRGLDWIYSLSVA